MSNYSCSYDCRDRPATVSPYPDISGIGVVIGYVATAGIVVSIIIFSFLATYEPTENPFQKRDEPENGTQTSEFRPNPVDAAFLSYIRRRQFRPCLKNACFKCVLAMSDLQIVTGISILISGYIQLPCGLSVYHWQVLVYLAWFSCLTHLSCLTFLRNHLYNRPGERIWRLAAMALLLVMLLVAMIPTGHYEWTGRSGPNPSDLAICYLLPTEDSNSDPTTFASMILSVLLLSVGFLVRAVKLHKRISVDIVRSARHAVSVWLRRRLFVVYKKLNLENSPKRLARRLIFRPLLATFLILRVGIDTWTSMTVEVWWLVASFIWGVLNLLGTLAIGGGGTSDWSFGQVVPVVLLATPLLSLFEYLYSDETPADSSTTLQNDTVMAAVDSAQTHTQEQIQPMEIALPGDSEHVDNLRDHPERDYYARSPWVKDFIAFIIMDMLGSTILIFILNFSENRNQKLVALLIPNEVGLLWEWLPIYQFLGLLLFVLFSLLIEDFSVEKRCRLISPIWRKRMVKSFRWTLSMAVLYMEVAPISFDYTVFLFFGIYIMCAFALR